MVLEADTTYYIFPNNLTGIPHSTMQDDIYNGMFIPKGTMVFANAWCVSSEAVARHLAYRYYA